MTEFVAEIPIISDIFDPILGGIGQVLAWIYDVIPNYGLSIIVLTVIVRLVLLPLGVKQIRSMHNMQTLQPKIKALQTKYKGNKTKQQEEVMKLYKESGVNPLSGCWPVILQFPILIAMYQVLRPPVVDAVTNKPGTVAEFSNNHLPEGSELYNYVTTQDSTDFLWMNLQCAPIKAGTGDVPRQDSEGKNLVAGVENGDGEEISPDLDCGTGIPVRIPYYAFLLLMIGTTFFQQRQMQRAAPPGSQNPQQQAIFKFMPIVFGVFGIAFPSALVLYWVTSNAWQIGQQATMLKLGHIGPAAAERTQAAAAAKSAKGGGRKGFMASLSERAEQERTRRAKSSGGKPKGGSPKKGSTGKSGGSAGKRTSGGSAKAGGSPKSGGSPKKTNSKGGSGGAGSGGSKQKPRPKPQNKPAPPKNDTDGEGSSGA